MRSKAEKRPKHKAHQKVEREKKRANRRGQYRQERKKKKYNPVRYLSRNQKESGTATAGWRGDDD